MKQFSIYRYSSGIPWNFYWWANGIGITGIIPRVRLKEALGAYFLDECKMERSAENVFSAGVNFLHFEYGILFFNNHMFKVRHTLFGSSLSCKDCDSYVPTDSNKSFTIDLWFRSSIE